jgi:predicted metal-dependent hydrolase
VRKTPYFKLIINEYLLVDREVVWAVLLHELTHMKLKRSAHDGAFYAMLFRYISPERYEELRERGEAIILQALRARRGR